MGQAAPVAESEAESADHAALLLMLAYVEAECRRIGATDAAKHAAIAAALMPRPGPGTAPCPAPPLGERVH